MTEKPKTECDDSRESSEKCVEQSSWAEDQEKHEYYYDDAHGYEVYSPNEETAGEQGEGGEEEDSKPA